MRFCTDRIRALLEVCHFFSSHHPISIKETLCDFLLKELHMERRRLHVTLVHMINETPPSMGVFPQAILVENTEWATDYIIRMVCILAEGLQVLYRTLW